jgi:hypothetical protein
MTLNDLVKIYHNAAWEFQSARFDKEDEHRGIKAVVAALRNDLVPSEYTHLTNAEKGWLQFFNEILADDEVKP